MLSDIEWQYRRYGLDHGIQLERVLTLDELRIGIAQSMAIWKNGKCIKVIVNETDIPEGEPVDKKLHWTSVIKARYQALHQIDGEWSLSRLEQIKKVCKDTKRTGVESRVRAMSSEDVANLPPNIFTEDLYP